MRTSPIVLVNPTRVAEIIASRVVEEDGCLIWRGGITPDGYGSMSVKTPEGWKRRKAHRVAWILQNGDIPPGMVIDHLCGVRGCCNPSHMEVVTQSVNANRSAPARYSTCPKCGGSEWVEWGGRQRCRPCRNDWFRQYQRDQRPDIVCPECGASFQRTRQNMAFCCRECAKTATLRRRREWAKAKYDATKHDR